MKLNTTGDVFLAVCRGEAIEPSMISPVLLHGVRRLADRCAQEAREKYRLADYYRAEGVLDEHLSRAEREAMAATVVEEKLRKLL